MKHTPGPWGVVDENPTIYVCGQNEDLVIADCREANDRDELLANARLIAAAPEMLAALNEISEIGKTLNTDGACLHDIPRVVRRVVDNVRSAIAKAEGTQSD